MDQTLIADRYEVRELLGHGAGGTVLAAMDRLGGRMVSLRLIRRSAPAAVAAISHALREARAAGRLRHPGILAMHGAGLCPDYAWIAHEAAGGETLHAALERRGPPPLADALRIMSEVLAALGAAHDLGLVHRDVTPGNILLAGTPEPRWGTARLAGFGCGRLGEVLAGQEPAGPECHRAADLHAAGLVFHALLAGTGVAGPAPPPHLSPLLKSVLARALAHEPADRFRDAAGMADAIRVAAAHHSTRSHSRSLVALIGRKRV